MRTFLHRLSSALPQRARSALIDAWARLPFEVRATSTYRAVRRQLDAHRHVSVAAARASQEEQLGRLMEHAYANVPYYRAIMQERGLKPADVASVEGLRRLPTLDKDQVMEQAEHLVARNVPPHMLEPMNTGGSTGRTLRFSVLRGHTFQRELAFMHDQWARVGYRPGDRVLRVRGDAPPTPGGLWRNDPAHGALALSTYNLSPDRVPEVVRRLEEFQPRFLHVYPSTVAWLTRLLTDAGAKPRLRGLQAILCGSEAVRPDQRRDVGAFWGCRLYSWYGHGELCLLGGGCEETDDYHFFSEYGVLELLPLQFEGAAPGLCELVGTSLNNPAMPLVRYRTQDMGVPGPVGCSRCGRPYPLVPSVEGRLQEFVQTADGRLISVTALVWGQHYACFGRIAKFQLEQSEAGVVTVRVVRRKTFGLADEREIVERMATATGGQLRAVVTYVEDIPPTPSGKHKFLLQRLPLGIGE